MKKNKRILLILLIAAVVLTALYFAVVRPLVNRRQNSVLEPVALLDGESYFQMNGNESDQIPVMFPQVDREDLYDIRILNNEENYGLTHYLTGGKDYFLMWTGDGEVYLPELARMSAGFDYTTLYDETSKIPSLITGAGCVVFKDRAYVRAAADPAPSDEEYQTILHRYGLADADHPVSYEIRRLMRDDLGNPMYSDGDSLYCTDGDKTNPRYWDAFALRSSGYDYEGTPTADVTGKHLLVLPDAETIRVYVGDLLPDESGYYLRLDGRDVVYTTGTAVVGRIVYKTLSYYICPRLVQASEGQDSSFYTPSFRIFSGTGEKSGGITSADTVLFSAAAAYRDGTEPDRKGALALGSGALPENLVEALAASGASVGDTIPLLVGSEVEPHWTVKSSRKTLYAVYAVSAVLRGGEYLDADGTTVLPGDTAICAYTADGAQAVGMIGLSDALAALRDAIVGLPVGAGTGEPLSFATVDFSDAPTFETAVYQVESIQKYARNRQFTSGLTVWNNSDKTSVQTADLPSSGSRGYVWITYSVKRNGLLAVEEDILCLDGGNATLAGDAMAQAILASDFSSGKLTLGYREGIRATVSLPADPFTSYLVYRDFRIEGIFGAKEEIGVRFVNDTERNIFYGGSAYEITSPAARTVYSVNNDNLMNVLQDVFSEATGSETVAVGLTKEHFDEYGLGAHVVYFEMPLGLTPRDGTSMDFGVRERIGFHLYISEKKTGADGDFYYVASDLYGTVVRAAVSDCDLSFVDWEFGSKWIDDDLLLLNLVNIRDISFRINYTDRNETHGFAVSVNPVYHTSMSDDNVTQRIYVAYVPGSNPTYLNRVVDARSVETDNRNYSIPDSGKWYRLDNRSGQYYRTDYGVQLTPRNENFYSVRIVSNESAIGLDDHYQNRRGGAELSLSGVYYEGVANFTKLITLIYTSEYSGSVSLSDLSESEKARVADLLASDEAGNFTLSDDDPSALEKAVFTITLTLVDGRVFRLAFYPYSAGRYLLSFEDRSAGIVSREFYMNMGEIKNMVTAVRTVVAGGTVRYDESYLPEPD